MTADLFAAIDRRDDVLDAIASWASREWLRPLDAALVRFVASVAPSADGVVLLATALVANLEGQGHTCLVIDDLLHDPAATLQWTADAADALTRLLAVLPGGASAWVEALSRCDAVSSTGRERDGNDGGGEPLVLFGGRLYLRRYWRHERRVADAVRARIATSDAVDENAARSRLDLLMSTDASDAAPTGADEVDWQRVACAIALRSRLSIVTGGPGTGKTFTAARTLALLFASAPHPETLRIALAAPTGKAAARLRQSIDRALATMGASDPSLRDFAARIGPAKTLHALLGTRPGTRRFLHDAARPLDVDLVIVDEASMVHIEMMDALLDALPLSARLMLLGDKDQLASVEAGAVLGELCRDADTPRYTPDTARYVAAMTGRDLPRSSIDPAGPPLAQRIVMLRRSRRFGGTIAAIAGAVNAGDAGEAEALLQRPPDGSVRWILSPTTDRLVDLATRGADDALANDGGSYRVYLDAMSKRPTSSSPVDHAAWARTVLDAFDAFRVLCAVRAGEWGVDALNRAIALRLVADGILPTASGEWYEGRPVIVTRNDHDLGVFNGDVGIVLRGAEGDGLRAWFADAAGARSVGVARLSSVETAFAMTVHKSQGSEFDHTVLVLPPEANAVTTRELVYTGLTRARRAFTLASARREALVDAVARTTRRASGLIGFVDRA